MLSDSELASFQKCSKGFSHPSESSNGMTEERFSQDKVRGKENSHSKQETQRVSSLWGLIQGFMGNRNSREGFATVSMDTSVYFHHRNSHYSYLQPSFLESIQNNLLLQ